MEKKHIMMGGEIIRIVSTVWLLRKLVVANLIVDLFLLLQVAQWLIDRPFYL